MGRGAIFIDRDGTISVDCRDEDRVGKLDLQILPHAPDAIRLLNQTNLALVVVTNQPGIGKGLFSREKVEEEHRRMVQYLEKNGAYLHAIYYCPHVDADNCDCRKPKPGMLLRAKSDLGIDFTRSYFVGDSWKDIACGNSVGCKSILIEGNHGRHGCGEMTTVANLLEAAVIISKLESQGG